MTDDELAVRIAEMRARGATPKGIARALGVRPAEIERLNRRVAQATHVPGEPALVGCWVSPGWSVGLSWTGHPEWEAADPMHMGRGMASVAVARQHRYGKIAIGSVLLDTYCLGVKNAIPPRVIEADELGPLISSLFRIFPGDPVPVTLELAQHLVLGSLAYASDLGFEPHPDFARCRDLLGPWQGPSCIQFGRDGKPYYVNGPEDDTLRILTTLRRSVGAGNFEYRMIG